mmetsp:Transcript_40869/g.53850  ORF Transcript_40869/g.53850 Transcript_40869/m.53850 type:complete len:207 (-) Transcript_40869:8-628(-)
MMLKSSWPLLDSATNTWTPRSLIIWFMFAWVRHQLFRVWAILWAWVNRSPASSSDSESDSLRECCRRTRSPASLMGASPCSAPTPPSPATLPGTVSSSSSSPLPAEETTDTALLFIFISMSTSAVSFSYCCKRDLYNMPCKCSVLFEEDEKICPQIFLSNIFVRSLSRAKPSTSSAEFMVSAIEAPSSELGDVFIKLVLGRSSRNE